jgi:predicted DNA-binding transcriptional regulator AlpA
MGATTKRKKQPAAVQVTVARTKAAALLAQPGVIRLLSKHEICAIAGVSYPTIWAWMRAGEFPRSRVAGGRSMWVSAEVEAWLNSLPVRPLKGDAERGIFSTTNVAAAAVSLAAGRKT